MTIAAFALVARLELASVEAFRPVSLTSRVPQIHTQPSKEPLTIMYRIRCENKYYQLEELEDADNCTTELFLKADGTVDIGETDGPLFTKAVGNWEIKENDFAMTITKTFVSGNEKNDMGEFSFDVERVFTGEMTVVGGTEVAINGKIYAEDIITEKHEKEVGFFNMIDGTDLRLERRPDARPKDTGIQPSPVDSNDVKGHDGANTDDARFAAMQAVLGSSPPKSNTRVSAFGDGSFGQDAQGFGGGGNQYGQQQQEQTASSNWGTGNGYGQSQQAQTAGISEGTAGFGQGAQGYGGGSNAYGQPQQSPASSWGTGSGYGQQQQQSGGISEYGGGSFGQEAQGYGGGVGSYGQSQQAPNDPGPPLFANYGQQQQQQQPEEEEEEDDQNGYYSQNGGYNGNYNGGGGNGGLSPMGGGWSRQGQQ